MRLVASLFDFRLLTASVTLLALSSPSCSPTECEPGDETCTIPSNQIAQDEPLPVGLATFTLDAAETHKGLMPFLQGFFPGRVNEEGEPADPARSLFTCLRFPWQSGQVNYARGTSG